MPIINNKLLTDYKELIDEKIHGLAGQQSGIPANSKQIYHGLLNIVQNQLADPEVLKTIPEQATPFFDELKELLTDDGAALYAKTKEEQTVFKCIVLERMTLAMTHYANLIISESQEWEKKRQATQSQRNERQALLSVRRVNTSQFSRQTQVQGLSVFQHTTSFFNCMKNAFYFTVVPGIAYNLYSSLGPSKNYSTLAGGEAEFVFQASLGAGVAGGLGLYFLSIYGESIANSLISKIESWLNQQENTSVELNNNNAARQG